MPFDLNHLLMTLILFVAVYYNIQCTVHSDSFTDRVKYGKQKGLSTYYCPVNIIQIIFLNAHSNITEVTAILSTFIDWKDAFPLQCTKAKTKK